MAKDDIFAWLDALWTKRVPEGTPPTYMMHRFLASEPDFAEAARELQTRVREPALVFRIWQGLLPRGQGAPRLPYTAPKKPPAEEALVLRMMTVLGERRSNVEEIVSMLTTMGRVGELYIEFGVEPPKEKKRAES